METKFNHDLKKGPVVFTNNHEPLIFIRRRGGCSADIAERYIKERSPEVVREIKKLGINLVTTNYLKGFGLLAEAEDILLTEKFIKLCHEHGIKVGGYIGDTFIYETMLNEEPDCLNWAQRMPDGTPITYGGQVFRWSWCRTNPAFMEYMKKVFKRGIEAGLDLIHLDNFNNKPEPHSCHCIHCTKEFRNFLEKKYTKSEKEERFGFPDLTHVIPPVFSAPLYSSWNSEEISDPLRQDWLSFKCYILTERYKEICVFCKSLKEDIIMECNPSGIVGENTAYMRSVNHASLLPHGDFFWDESPNPFGQYDNGAFCTRIRSMKLGEQTSNRVFYYSNSDIKVAEGLAFNNGCIGMIGYPKLDSNLKLCANNIDPKISKYIELLYEKPGIFCETKSIAEIAVLRNFSSLAFNSGEPQLQAILAEETLLANHIPFDIILNIDSVNHRVLILPGTESLSSRELDRISIFVKAGGTLILTGNSGEFDEWRRSYAVNPFERLMEDTGRGRVYRIPPLELPSSAPAVEDRAVWDSCYQVWDGRYWMLPSNSELLTGIICSEEIGNCSPVAINARRTTMVEPRLSSDGKNIYIHILDYEKDISPQDINIVLNLKFRDPIVKQVYPGEIDLGIKSSYKNGRLELNLRNNAVYSLISLAGLVQAIE